MNENHEYTPRTPAEVGEPCEVCGQGRRHPWHYDQGHNNDEDEGLADFTGWAGDDVGDDREVVTIIGVRPFGMFDTIITFDGVDENGLAVVVAVDHRPARDLRLGLAHIQAERDRLGDMDFQDLVLLDDIVVEVEAWQVIGRYSPKLDNGEWDPWSVAATQQYQAAAEASMAEREADRAAGRE